MKWEARLQNSIEGFVTYVVEASTFHQAWRVAVKKCTQDYKIAILSLKEVSNGI